MRTGRPAEAEALLREARDVARRALGETHVQSAWAGAWLGVCRAERGARDEGRDLRRAALAALRAAPPAGHPYRVEGERELARLGASAALGATDPPGRSERGGGAGAGPAEESP